MTRDLQDIFRRHQTAMEPLATGVEPRLTAFDGVRAVLFDVYGTLLISGSGGPATEARPRESSAMTAALGAVGLEPQCSGDAIAQRWHAAIERSHAEGRARGIAYPEVDVASIWKEVLSGLVSDGHLSASAMAIDCRRLSVEYEARANPTWPMPHVRETLDSLRAAGLLVGLVSNCQFHVAELFPALLGATIDELGFAPDLQILSYRVGHAKPGVEIFRVAAAALRQRGLSPGQALYVGNDLLNDIRPAREAGFRTILFAGDARSLRLHENDASLRGVVADAVVVDPLEVLACVGLSHTKEMATPLPGRTRERILSRLHMLYGTQAAAVCARLEMLVADDGADLPPRRQGWDQRDAILITYGDQIHQPGRTPLATLRQWLLDHHWDQLLSAVHLLPFFPYSSDDGFSVIDYCRVDPALGSWEEVSRLANPFELVFDLVLNHVSARSAWFQGYLQGLAPYEHYFLEVDPAADVSAVARPRSEPLLTRFETSRGARHLWTTFSADQIDLNYAEPDVLLEMVGVLLDYLRHGARIVRLDAIAYLWKRLGTPCIHLSETHEVVKLLRDLVDAVAPGTLLLTETNVPHAENVRYFGAGDEARLVYQFSLAPLLLDAYLHGDALPLTRWLADLEPPPPGTTYLNFTASHDGVGLRPLEGLVDAPRLAQLVESVEARGGRVSFRREADGRQAPYELNITYFDALSRPEEADSRLHVRRFLASQAIMLALQGLPGIYFHSLLGTRNDQALVERTGRARSINRRKFQLSELGTMLESGSIHAEVFAGYRRLLGVRRDQPALHPDAAQQVCRVEDPSLLALLRTSPDKSRRIALVANFSGQMKRIEMATLGASTRWRCDLLNGRPIAGQGAISLAPYQVVWLEGKAV